MPRKFVPVLPGLSFPERPQLFSALVATAQDADRALEVYLNDRRALLLLSPDDVRAVLYSRARKGRPAKSLKGIGGHIAADGPEFGRKRGAVMAALRDAAPEPSDEFRIVNDVDGGPPELATLVMANLSGRSWRPDVHELCQRARVSMRAAIGETKRGDAHHELRRINADLQDLLVPSSPFVRGLLQRSWSLEEIAGEIVTLTFAGWASLAAVFRTAQTLGVVGPHVTQEAVTELLRIAPPGWLITRESVDPLLVPSRDKPIAPETLLVMSPWLLHRNQSYWERPEEFDTSRQGSRNHPAYLPFSAGTRGCPAERYSRAFLQTLLVSQPENPPFPRFGPSLMDERSTCLVPLEDHPI